MTRHTEPHKAAPGGQYATFSAGGLFFGVEVLEVQEVLRYQEMTRVPLAPGAIAGLINLRGQIVTAIDLRSRFGLSRRAAEETPANLVVRSADGPVSLLVDEIGDVLEVPADCFEAVPDHTPREQRELLRGVYKLERRLLLALDTERVVRAAVPG